MTLNEKQKRRADGFYNVLKNFMVMQPDEYIESKIEICKDCNGTGLSGFWNNAASGDCGWDGTEYCDKCHGVGFVNIDSKFKSITDDLYVCGNCDGIGCSNCNYTGLVDWIKNVMSK